MPAQFKSVFMLVKHSKGREGKKKKGGRRILCWYKDTN
jgi:hypothetical protein